VDNRKRFKAVNFDYDYLLDFDADTCLYCLSPVTVQLCLSMLEMASWQTRYFSLVGTNIEKDIVQEWADRAQSELMTNFCACPQWRNDPDDPPQTQVSCDSGVTWQNAFRLDIPSLNVPDNTLPILYKTYVTDQHNMQIIVYNIMKRYDGVNANSINPDAPNDLYNGDASDDRNAALCMAVVGYVYPVIQYFKVSAIMAQIGGFVVDQLLQALVGLVVPFIDVALELSNIISFQDLGEVALHALEDPIAVNHVICCMVDSLAGEPITRGAFEASLDSCGFIGGSNEAIVRDFVASSFVKAGNWASFVDALGTAYLAAQAGVRDCPCTCESFDYNWHDNIAVDQTGWTTGNTGIWPQSLFGAPTLTGGYEITGPTQIAGNGYLTAPGHSSSLPGLDGNIFGAYTDFDPAGCMSAKVFVSAYANVGQNSAGFHVLVYRAGVWEDAGGENSWTGNWGYHEAHVDVDMTAVTKVGIVFIAALGIRIGRIRLVFV